MSRILVTGATGFVGQELIKRLIADGHQVVAVSRGPTHHDDRGVEWRQADIFSLKDITLAMEGCDQAVYLVHSMLPSSSLMQGEFYDTDLILADNFARASRKIGLKHVLYLGGLVPDEKNLSWHLRSRLEVEETLQNSADQVTVLRASIIIGKGGSSFVILRRLVERLPVMLLPQWTNTPTQPIDLRDLIEILSVSLSEAGPRGEVWDVGGPEVVTYRQMMQEVAKDLYKKPAMLNVSAFSLNLSRLWLRLITQAPKSLIYPLVLSLRYPMTVRSERQFPRFDLMKITVTESLKFWLKQDEGKVYAFTKPFTLNAPKHVRSVQHLVLPQGKDAAWVAEEYFKWLPQFFSFFIRIKIQNQTCLFYFLHPKIALLILEKSIERSAPDRQLLYIKGGFLAAREQNRGRLEFREALNGKIVLAAIHDFRPALPWIIYKWTQAVVHLFVMRAFGNHLVSMRRNP